MEAKCQVADRGCACAGQPDCAYYLRHGRCGFGPSCKFHHPEPGTAAAATVIGAQETAASSEQASTITAPPEAAVATAHVAQQQDGATDTLPAQTSGGTSDSTAEASPFGQAQQPQFVMTQPQYILPAASNTEYASTTYPQMPQPVLGQMPQVPQMQNVTTAPPHVTQGQYAAATTAQQQVPLAPTATYQPAAVGSLQQTYVAAPTATTAVDCQQPQAILAQTSGFVSVAQPQLQLQAQVPQGSVLPAPQQVQPPLRSASLPVEPSLSAQQQQEGPTTLQGSQQAQAAAAVASVPVLQAQLQQLVLHPASGKQWDIAETSVSLESMTSSAGHNVTSVAGF